MVITGFGDLFRGNYSPREKEVVILPPNS